jgi:hypothetical protein
MRGEKEKKRKSQIGKGPKHEKPNLLTLYLRQVHGLKYVQKLRYFTEVGF